MYERAVPPELVNHCQWWGGWGKGRALRRRGNGGGRPGGEDEGEHINYFRHSLVFKFLFSVFFTIVATVRERGWSGGETEGEREREILWQNRESVCCGENVLVRRMGRLLWQPLIQRAVSHVSLELGEEQMNEGRRGAGEGVIYPSVWRGGVQIWLSSSQIRTNYEQY